MGDGDVTTGQEEGGKREREKVRLWEDGEDDDDDDDDDDDEGVFIVATDTTYGYIAIPTRRCHGLGASLGTGQEQDRDPPAGPAHDACR
jgi:hypothetical protein